MAIEKIKFVLRGCAHWFFVACLIARTESAESETVLLDELNYSNDTLNKIAASVCDYLSAFDDPECLTNWLSPPTLSEEPADLLITSTSELEHEVYYETSPSEYLQVVVAVSDGEGQVDQQLMIPPSHNEKIILNNTQNYTFWITAVVENGSHSAWRPGPKLFTWNSTLRNEPKNYTINIDKDYSDNTLRNEPKNYTTNIDKDYSDKTLRNEPKNYTVNDKDYSDNTLRNEPKNYTINDKDYSDNFFKNEPKNYSINDKDYSDSTLRNEPKNYSINIDKDYSDSTLRNEPKNYSINSDKDYSDNTHRNEPKNYTINIDRDYSDMMTCNCSNVTFSWNVLNKLDTSFRVTSSCRRNTEEVHYSKESITRKSDEMEIKYSKNVTLGSKCYFEVAGLGKGRLLYDIEPQVVKSISSSASPSDVGWDVHVNWLRPEHVPDRYRVELLVGEDEYKQIVSGKATTTTFHEVLDNGLYQYSVSVCAFKGPVCMHNFAPAIFKREEVASSSVPVLGSLLAVILLATMLMSSVVWCQRRRHAKVNLLFSEEDPEDFPEKPLPEFSVGDVPMTEDDWEIRPEKLRLHEVIGEGAFGVVRRGTLAPGKPVAVKMLKDYPSRDEVRSFRAEMELMKSVGAHPHVVSLVGCCSGRRPLIVAEYCGRGDLLSYLRCSWDVMISKRNAKYCNNNLETCNYRNDLFKSKPQEHSKLVVNKMYDLNGMCDVELTYVDLLSFCRQIAMGMEFLASNRVVHRDLAARNVLVTSDRTLKIADFGLSRDIYQENQYKQKGNGKMPVKWMALESLTHRIYTTQSDVWSFGVVAWEVVTVGGAPYADVAAARLPRLLRAGYRMPRPNACSKQLYDLMLSCWRARPRERPTFAELHSELDSMLHCACAEQYLALDLDVELKPEEPRSVYWRLMEFARGKRRRGSGYAPPARTHSNHYSSPPAPNKPAPLC